jgi:Uma2 family endonuclease
LNDGEHLDQKTFHARYEAMPDHVRAELIEGVVHLPSPIKRSHGRIHAHLGSWLLNYEQATPGTEAYDRASTILGPHSEVQPDACLLIVLPGVGLTRDEDEYIVGAPELVAEVALSTEAIDLHDKKRDYERAGVKEYIVAALRQSRVFWFRALQGKFEELPPGPDGILRSEVFSGLWLDPAALLRRDSQRLREVLQQGLGTPEHADLIAQLAIR